VKIPIFNLKRRRFCVKKKKRRDQATRRLVTVHHLPREAVSVAVLQAHLMPRLAPKIDKSCTKMAT
jgi:hypothetical protein